ncbi:cytochrome P450 [Mycolicibacterium agri]|uniref:Cytochrome P450 n=1 Tax=Mycolicibacterium agri TaxID=36811 RepID=A0A2A7MX10_MYCAG|nr:cytochrome P450 [Mycolicibacterium agri]PEG36027.1 cytochrome P450 [Mycolicibacterium agri]GFG54339.1 cytochrome P450 [Mycolicibacterium agri]
MPPPATTTSVCDVPTPERSSPPPVRSPKLVAGVGFAICRRAAMRKWIKRYGRLFEINVPFFGRTVIVSDPPLARSVCTARGDAMVNVQPNLSNWFGPGSVFGLDGAFHHGRRRLLAPAFHGRALKVTEAIVEEQTLREIANWPENTEFRTLEPMTRITLNVILRTIFGAECAELDQLRALIPPYMTLGQRLAFVTAPPPWVRRLTPWSRLDEYRRAFDRIVGALIDRAASDLGDRTDVLALLVRSGQLTRQDVCDEVLTLIGAGHETTASALAWAFERLRRHPDVLAELVREADAGGGDFRRATISELLRVRTVIDVAGRRVHTPGFDLGNWRIPCGRNVIVRIVDIHENPALYADPEVFDPNRFRDARPTAGHWLAFGGGARRCIGAEYATTEMEVVLRTVLQHLRIHTDAAPDEKPRFRGVAHVPRLGGRIVVSRRR